MKVLGKNKFGNIYQYKGQKIYRIQSPGDYKYWVVNIAVPGHESLFYCEFATTLKGIKEEVTSFLKNPRPKSGLTYSY